MGVREEVLGALEAARGEHLSGAALARRLSVSRNAVWKAVEALRGEGYRVESTSLGYRLSEDTDRLSAPGIARFLEERSFYRLTARRQVDSTNLELKSLAAQGAPEGTVLVAEAQSAGRGRMGRSFFSPEGTGAYFSILLRPAIAAREALNLTTVAAVAVAEAIGHVARREARIKWVNDVLVDDRKVCGILTEASLDLESGGLEYAVVGIGLNVRPPEGGLPEELSGIAGTIYEADPPGDARCALVAEVLNGFCRYYRALDQKAWLPAYRARSAVLGRSIEVISTAGARRALATAIDDEFRLHVRYEDDTEEALSSGEVSTRL